MLSAATGRSYEAASFDRLGEKIWNLTRLFNLREGIDPSQDKLPKRFVEEALPSGPYKGHRISEEDMAYLRQDYYRLRGWDEQGRPSQETLKRLEITTEPQLSLSAE
jgi:aldehyde:ferredoxin oxidoreductase